MGNLFLLAGLFLALIYIYDSGGFGGDGFAF